MEALQLLKYIYKQDWLNFMRNGRRTTELKEKSWNMLLRNFWYQERLRS
jgi:hypothetical protein